MLDISHGLEEGQEITNLTADETAFIEQTYKDIIFLYSYYPLFLYITGLPANIVSIYILRSSESLKRNFVSVFLVYLSFCNIMNSLVGLSRFFLVGMFDFDIRTLSLIASRMLSSMAMIFHVVANWILISLSLCKLLYIAYPYRANVWCGQPVTHAFMVLIILLSTLFHIFITEGGKNVVFTEMSTVQDSSHFLVYSRARAIIQACIFFYIPAAIILLVNFIIIYLYSRTKRNVPPASRLLRRHLQIAHRFAIITLLCDIQIMIMEFPYAYFFTEKYNWIQSGPVEEAKANLFYAVAVMMLYTNYSINFIVYCFFGNHYRQQLRKMLRPFLQSIIPNEKIWSSTPTETSDFSYESAFAGQGNLQAAGSLRNLFNDPLEETRLSRRRSEFAPGSECSAARKSFIATDTRYNVSVKRSPDITGQFWMKTEYERQKPRLVGRQIFETEV